MIGLTRCRRLQLSDYFCLDLFLFCYISRIHFLGAGSNSLGLLNCVNLDGDDHMIPRSNTEKEFKHKRLTLEFLMVFILCPYHVVYIKDFDSVSGRKL